MKNLALFGKLGIQKCKNCTNPCCSWVTPPIVTPIEASLIAERTRLPLDEVVSKRRFADGRSVLYLAENTSDRCRFYNPETKKCTVYAYRPADCRLFPLDIDRHAGKLRWIRYNVCELAAVITGDDLHYAEAQVVPILAKMVECYADDNLHLYDTNEWTDLGQVRQHDVGAK